jgi:hypothetical protein
MSVVAAAESLKRFGVRVHTSVFPGCAAIEFPKAAPEIGKIAETNVRGDLSYLPKTKSRLAKHAIGARQALVDKKT